MFPSLQPAELELVKSAAERKFYRSCQSDLPDHWTVLFSTPWVGTTLSGRRDGEADFVILVPDLGMLVVEVKGGAVSYDPEEGAWLSTDRTRKQHKIKNPFRQAVEEKHQLIRILRADPRWARSHHGKLLVGHAVMFADVDRLDAAVSPESPRGILGGLADIRRLEAWVSEVLQFWANESDTWTPLSKDSAQVIVNILHGRIEARPLLASVLAEEERVRIKLTEQQSRVLRGLGSRKRAKVSGGAGTGKTLLAVEKARQLAADVGQTLLLCYNNLLADHIKTACSGIPNLYAMTFHELCQWRCEEVRARFGRDVIAEAKADHPSSSEQEYFDLVLPSALTDTIDILPERFDAIVIDEGQDFKDEYWIPIEFLLQNLDESILYVFFDENQALYTKASKMPITDQPFLLTVNCRNTVRIHDAAYRYYEGEPTDAPESLEGMPISTIVKPTVDSQAKRLSNEIVRLLNDEGVDPSQIAVLVCGQPKRNYYEALEPKALPKSAQWVIEGVAADKGVRVDTVRRFKGLEADIVFLWGVDALPEAGRREVLYVGLSRAKSRLTVVGSEAACRSLVPSDDAVAAGANPEAE